MKRVYLVRHGQTVGNLGKFFQFPDTELSEAGHKGGKAVAERFRHIEVDLLVASGFTRAQQTAGYISGVIDIPVTTFEQFHEQHGPLALRGVSHESEEGVMYKKDHKENFFNKDWHPDGAENYFDVLTRVEECVSFLEESTEENIVVVSHATYIKMLSSYLLLAKQTDVLMHKKLMNGLKKMSNVGVSEFLYEDGQWGLKHWNDIAHFAE